MTELPHSVIGDILTPEAKDAILRIMSNKANKEQLLRVMLWRAYWKGYQDCGADERMGFRKLPPLSEIPDKARQLRNPPI